MSKAGCAREEELLDALQASRWPDACDAELREHALSCALCTDLLAVVAPLLDEHRALVQDASVPSSAIVWWRAQMRSRREAAARAAQPISFVFGIAVACAAGLLATALGIFVPTFRRALGWMAETTAAWPGLPIPSDPLTNPMILAGIAALGLCLLVAPAVLYFTFRED
jgi:hypothetical protein